MRSVLSLTFHAIPLLVSACSWINAQVAIAGRVVDENGTAVAGARVELRARTPSGGGLPDQRGTFARPCPPPETTLSAPSASASSSYQRNQPFEAGPSSSPSA